MMDHFSRSLVTTDWLADRLDDDALVILDGSFTLPGITPTAQENFATRHIRGAAFFDIERIADAQDLRPHMLPSLQQFQEQLAELGVANDSMIVVYDTVGLMSAGRVWWMMRVFGHKKIAILNGGLKKWLAEGRPVVAGVTGRRRRDYVAVYNESLVCNKEQLLANLETVTAQVIDARPRARFLGEEVEPRPDLRPGHMPNSVNLPFDSITEPSTGEVKGLDVIEALFLGIGLDLSNPIVATCGSGVTACALAFALHLLGREDVAVYDGSWAEWGMIGETPVTQM